MDRSRAVACPAAPLVLQPLRSLAADELAGLVQQPPMLQDPCLDGSELLGVDPPYQSEASNRGVFSGRHSTVRVGQRHEFEEGDHTRWSRVEPIGRFDEWQQRAPVVEAELAGEIGGGDDLAQGHDSVRFDELPHEAQEGLSLRSGEL